VEDRASKYADPIATEAPLDPALPICDAHHHLWRRPAGDYLLDELLQDLRSGHNIVATVAIECRYGYRLDGAEELKPIGETEFLESVANRVRGDSTIKPRVASAVVGHADLALGDAVAPVLEGHLAASPTRFRGIRHSTTWDQSDALRSDAPPGLLADRNFRRGFGRLQRLGLSFDAWLYHPQLPELAELARAFPGVTIVLDHIGAPLGVGPYAGKSREVYQAWSKGIATVAACPNVAVKLGGVGSSRSGYDWHERPAKPSSMELAEALKPYIERCIEAFGVERCMFESNFPVEKSSNDYVNLWNAFKRIAAKYSESERAALFHDTATRVYRIQ
jgi:predicted TIM-barrel fold metal-dependent hydrolase